MTITICRSGEFVEDIAVNCVVVTIKESRRPREQAVCLHNSATLTKKCG